MLLRLLFTLALIGALFWLWRRRNRQIPPSNPTQPSSEPMLRCAHCGVHIPQRLALISGSASYCSLAHQQQGPSPRER